MVGDPVLIPERGVLALSDVEWERAALRADVISKLVSLPKRSSKNVEEAAQTLKVSKRTIYLLISRWMAGGGLVTDMARLPNHGGKGKSRLSVTKEKIIEEAIDRIHLSRPRRSVATLMREIQKQSLLAGLHPPATNTVTSRISLRDPASVLKLRYGPEAARNLRAVSGSTPPAQAPMDVIQMDHTPMDVMVVDSSTRESIGRPYLTLAIDEFSRCIVGFVITLEAPSAVSAGLCLANAVSPKSVFIERMDVDVSWPMDGLMRSVYLDNAAEFKGEAIRRGCAQYGIALHYRPIGSPHYGGIVERVIGTFMRMVHELPGTTFSNHAEKGDYASEKCAALTMLELQKWMTLAICGVYHNTNHSTILQSPLAKWADGIAMHGSPKAVVNPESFLVDFLPVKRRILGRAGFVIDHIAYFSNALKPWIARRHELGKFTIRFDPRDISRIWVLDASVGSYLEVPYRTLSNPAATTWEQRGAIARLRAHGRSHIDETAIFRSIEEMRKIAEQAAASKKSARRSLARRAHLNPSKQKPVEPPLESGEYSPVRPFEEIEEW